MFPMLNLETRDLAPECYFGGCDVPPYHHAQMPDPGCLKDLLDILRNVAGGANASGYVDREGVHFHLADDDTVYVDLSRTFVFISQPAIEIHAVPTAWQVMFFLMEPVRQALFVTGLDAVLITKTDRTMRLCRALDQLWAQDAFMEMRIAMVESEDAREKGLARLMKVHEEEIHGASSMMWKFWPVFGEFLMEHALGLEVYHCCDL